MSEINAIQETLEYIERRHPGFFGEPAIVVYRHRVTVLLSYSGGRFICDTWDRESPLSLWLLNVSQLADEIVERQPTWTEADKLRTLGIERDA